MNHIDAYDGNHEILRGFSSEIRYTHGETMAVVARLEPDEGSPLPIEPFDPAKSYGQTRSEFEADFEHRYVSWLLARHSGNISAAAREARMDRKHLHDLAKKHGLRGREAATRR